MRYILQRVGQLVLVLFAVTAITFASVNILGDPIDNILGPLAGIDCTDVNAGLIQDTASQGGSGEGDCAVIARTRAEFNLDDSVPQRYASWVGNIVTADFGTSFLNQLPVSDVIKAKFPVTLRLVAMGLVMSVGISIPWALLAAYRADRAFDNVSTVISFGLISVPNFAMGVILYYLFAVKWQIFPARYDPSSVYMQMKSLFLPALTLALPLAATYQRLLRTDLITTLQEDFVHMARAKGLPGRQIMLRHALRPSMFSIVTVFGINTGALLGGTLVIEQIFSVPGLGGEIVKAIIGDDTPVVLGIVVIIVSAFVIVNLFVDLMYTLLDPRVRRG